VMAYLNFQKAIAHGFQSSVQVLTGQAIDLRPAQGPDWHAMPHKAADRPSSSGAGR
jgi:hypothetical protein